VVVGTSDLQGNLFDSLGDLTIDDNLVVTGTSDLQGNIFDSLGNVTIDDNLDVIGNITATGNADFEGTLTSGTGDAFQVDADGRIVSIDGVAHTIEDVAGDLTLSSNSTNITLNDNVTFAGTTTLNSVTYTWPGADGSDGYVLSTDGLGTLAWRDPAVLAGATIYWSQENGALYPKNSSVDVLIGGQSTESAKFAFINVDSGTPTASISGTTANVATFITGEGNIQTTNNQTLVLGGSSTGDILLDENTYISGLLDVTGATTLNSTLVVVGTSDLQGNLFDSLGDLTIDDNLVVTGTSDLQGNVFNSTGNLVLDDTVDIGSATTGIRITPTGVISDIDGNVVIEDTVNITGSITATGNADFEGTLTSGTSDAFQVDADGRIVSIDGVAHTIEDVAGDLTLSSNSTIISLDDNVVISGTLAVNGDEITSDGTTLVINAGGNVDIQDDVTVDSLTADTGNINAALGTIQTGGVDRIDNDGNLVNIGTTQFNTVTYTWPGADGSEGYILSTNGAGTLSWIDPNLAAAAGIFWEQDNGALFPKNTTVDVLIGGQSTESAKFAFINVNSGTPTASISAGIAGATYLTADGTLATTAKQSINIGGSTSGDVNILDSADSAFATFTNSGTFILDSLYFDGNTIGLTTDTDLLSLANEELTVNGDLVLADTFTLQVGGLTGTTYNALANLGQSPTGANISSDNDLFIGGDLEVDGLIYADGGIDTAFSEGSVVFAGVDGLLSEDNSNFFWDSANDFLGLGTNTPTARLDIDGDASTSGSLVFRGATPSLDILDGSDLTLAFSPGGDTGLIDRFGFTHLGEFRLFDADASNYTSFIAPDTLSTNLTYTLPSSLTDGYILQTDGSGNLTWVDPALASAATVYWVQENGALYPKNSTVDVLIGGQTTESAKFAFINVDSGTPTASISASSGNIATYLTGDGTLATTNRQTLTIGNSASYDTTGDVHINSNGTGNVAIGTTTTSERLTVNGDLGLLAQGDLRLYDADSSNYTGFQAPTTLITNVVYTMPDADGTTGYVLSTDGAGVLSWASVGVGNTFFSANNTSIASGDYLELAHNQNTFDLLSTGWFFDVGSGAYKEVATATESAIIANNSETLAQGESLTVTHNQNTFDIIAQAWEIATDSGQWTQIVEPQGVNHDIQDPNLLAYWKMDEASGNLIDESNNGKTMTAKGSATYQQEAQVDGDTGYSVAFDGNDYFCTDSGGTCVDDADFDFAGDFTIGVWLKNDSPGSFQGLINKWNQGVSHGYILGIGGDGTPEFYGTAGSYLSYYSLPDGEWAFVTVTYDSTYDVLQMYINGKPSPAGDADTVKNTGVISNSTAPFTIGTYYTAGTPGNFYDGIMDEAFVYTRDLEPREIENLYQYGAKRYRLENPTLDTTKLTNLSGQTQSVRLGVMTRGFRLEQADNNTLRLYNYSGTTQNLRLSAAVGGGTDEIWSDAGDYVQLIDTSDNLQIGSGTGIHKLNVVGAITGKALVMFDELGDQDILTASASGVTRFSIANSGALRLYDDDGSNYTSFVAPSTLSTNIEYTLPSSLADGYILQTDGSGSLSWIDPDLLVSGSVFWTQDEGALYPKNSTVDVLIGSNATSSAEFAFTGLNTNELTAKLASTNFFYGGTPTELATVNTVAQVNEIQIVGNYAYVAKTVTGATCSGTTLDGCEIAIYDVTDPSDPIPLGGYDAGNSALDLKVSGQYLYFGQSSNVGTCSGATITGCEFAILDISDKSTPTAVGGYDVTKAVNAVALAGKYAYLGSDISGGTAPFTVLDISDPSAPTLGIFANFAFAINEVFIYGKYAFLGFAASTGSDIFIYDISDPVSPASVGGLSLTDASIMEIFVTGRYLHFTQTTNANTCSGSTIDGCEYGIADLADPTTPTAVAGVNLATNADGLHVAGNYAYVGHDAVSGNDIEIIDISTLSTPTVISGIDTGNDHTDVTVSGNNLFYGAKAADQLGIYQIHGGNLPTASVGNFAGTSLTLSNDAYINNNLYVNNAVNIGPGGLYVDAGEVAIDSVSSDTAFRLSQRGTGDIMNIYDGSTNVFQIIDGGNIGIGREANASVDLDLQSSTTNANAFRVVSTDGQILASIFETSGTAGRMSIYDAGANEDIRFESTGISWINNGTVNGLSVGTTSTLNAQIWAYQELASPTSGEEYAMVATMQTNAATTGLKQAYRAHASANHTTGTVSQIGGGFANARKDNTGAVTDLYGFWARVDNNNATGAVTNAYGLYIEDSIETGTITNDYGIYQVDTGARNYFGGTVGIGTITQNAKLHIVDGSSQVLAGNLTGAFGAVSFASTMAVGTYSLTGNGTSTFINAATGGSIGFAVNNSVISSMTSTSFVLTSGILPTSVGTNYLCWNSTGGVVSRQTTCVSSSIQYKENVENLNYGLSELMQLRPVSFTYRPEHNPDTSRKIGFIAEEMYQVIPEVVAYDDQGNIQGIDYQYLTSLNTRAIQQLAGKFDSQYSLTDSGDYTLSANSTTPVFALPEVNPSTVNSRYSLRDSAGNLVTQAAVYSNATIAGLRTGIIKTIDLVADNVRVGNKITSPLVEADQVRSNSIASNLLSPLSGETITVEADLKVNGDSTISGTLSAKTGQFETLEVERIRVDQVDGLSTTLTQSASTAAQEFMNTLLARYEQEIPGMTATSSASLLESIETEIAVSSLTADYIGVTSLAVGEFLQVSGPILTRDIFVEGSLVANSISSDSQTLFIQPMGTGSINFLAGILTLDASGNAILNGNLTITGRLAANELSADEATVSGNLNLLSSGGSFGKLLSIFDENGNVVASVDASGSATFNQVDAKNLTLENLIIASSSESQTASSSASTGSNASIGSASLAAGQTELTIQNAAVRESTLIYITPTSNTSNQVLYVQTKLEGSFSIAINQPVASDISFNYWLVQTLP
jgi:hypothetical protein